MNKKAIKVCIKLLKSGKYRAGNTNLLRNKFNYFSAAGVIHYFLSKKEWKLSGEFFHEPDSKFFISTSDLVVRFLGFSERTEYKAAMVKDGCLAAILENDIHHPNFDRAIKALEELL